MKAAPGKVEQRNQPCQRTKGKMCLPCFFWALVSAEKPSLCPFSEGDHTWDAFGTQGGTTVVLLQGNQGPMGPSAASGAEKERLRSTAGDAGTGMARWSGG